MFETVECLSKEAGIIMIALLLSNVGTGGCFDMRTMFGRGSNKFNLVKFGEPRKHDFSRISLSGEFILPDYARKAGNDIFINLNLFKHYLGEEIDFPKRKMPVELDFHFVRNYVTILKVPAGYKVAYLPESKSFYNKIWGFDIKYEQKGDAIILTQTFTNEHLLLTPDQFQEWNKVLESLFPLYKESVNLTKI